MIKKLKEYVVVPFHNQATVATRAMEDLKAPVVANKERHVRMSLPGTSREAGAANKTKEKHSPDAETDTGPILED